uniref:Gloverin n=1 Tax=Trichoplusia ni TaxID=7111 RepID=Q9GQM3_TRINI|nr:gloverin precursor [Trichoplusia ni]
MQSSILLIFAAFVACTYAQVSLPPGYAQKYPQYKYSKVARHPRDTTWEHNVGRGKIFGTLGSNDDSVFGRGGYKQDIFNDHRGRLSGQAYGSRVINDYGGSSILGGKLDWSNDNARAALDVHKEIGRGSGMKLSGDGVWKLDHNTRFSAGGNLQKNFGHNRPEFGIQGKIEHDF